MAELVYFPSATSSTERLVKKLDMPMCRVPLCPKGGPLRVSKEYVLVVPTYGGDNTKGAIPRQVVKFLNDGHNHSLTRGVISEGDMNLGAAYGLADDTVTAKCHIPYMYKFELLGTSLDMARVREGLEKFWQQAH